MQSRLYPVILAGGLGTRLWPLSRSLLPKQFLPLMSERSMFQETIARACAYSDAAPPIVISNEEHRFLVSEQLRDLGVAQAMQIIEPAGRGTAAAAALAALAALETDPQAVLAVLPADHLITKRDAFLDALRHAAALADAGHLVTFGVPPLEPATGFGYIVTGAPLPGTRGFQVARFVEKPDAAAAAHLLDSGHAFWNSGMFLFRASVFLEELNTHRPEIAACVHRAWTSRGVDLDFVRPGRDAFLACPADSIDYAIMEHTNKAAVLPVDIGWSDLGSWDALWQAGPRDAAGNVTRGDVMLLDARNCYVRSEGRVVSVLGASDLVIVETDDAVLVASRSHAQHVKEMVHRLAGADRTEHVSHKRVYRPWGYYESIDSAPTFQVKRLMVKTGEALSLQLHRRRAEHWVVVSGKALITRGEDVFELSPNQSTYIPIGMKHRIENKGTEPLFLIEVQSGDYLGEDDIERFDDRYRRG